MPRSERVLDYETGILSLTDRQSEFLEWLCGDRPEGESQVGYARRIGVAETTLARWKKDPSFVKLWNQRMLSTHAHPDVLSAQLKKLNEKALAGDTKSIELYWKLVDRMTPDRVEVSGSQSVQGMSDEALAQALAKAADAASARANPESERERAVRVKAELRALVGRGDG